MIAPVLKDMAWMMIGSMCVITTQSIRLIYQKKGKPPRRKKVINIFKKTLKI